MCLSWSVWPLHQTPGTWHHASVTGKHTLSQGPYCHSSGLFVSVSLVDLHLWVKTAVFYHNSRNMASPFSDNNVHTIYLSLISLLSLRWSICFWISCRSAPVGKEISVLLLQWRGKRSQIPYEGGHLGGLFVSESHTGLHLYAKKWLLLLRGVTGMHTISGPLLSLR